MWVKIVTFLVVLLAVIGGLTFPLLADRFAPYENKWNECLICGRTQIVEKDWRGRIETKVEEYDHSKWADTLSPDHEHHWATSSVESREDWFGSSMVGCGGYGGISQLYLIKTRQGDNAAQPLADAYLKVAQTGNLNAIQDHVFSEIHPAVEKMIEAERAAIEASIDE